MVKKGKENGFGQKGILSNSLITNIKYKYVTTNNLKSNAAVRNCDV